MIKLSDILKEQDKTKRYSLIEERIKELDSHSEQNKQLYINAIHKGFISRTSRVTFSPDLIVLEDANEPFTQEYTMKTTDYIPLFIDYIKEHNITNYMNAIASISPFLHEYFGTNKDYTNKFNREASYYNIAKKLNELKSQDEKEYKEYYDHFCDIAAFKGTSIAECSEFAALAQNILSFLGANSYYIGGSIYSKDKNENHAFNLVQTSPDVFFLADFSNPTILFDKDFNIINSQPRTHKMTIDEFRDAIEGKGINLEFTSSNYQKIDGKNLRIDKEIYVYEVKQKLRTQTNK